MVGEPGPSAFRVWAGLRGDEDDVTTIVSVHDTNQIGKMLCRVLHGWDHNHKGCTNNGHVGNTNDNDQRLL